MRVPVPTRLQNCSKGMAVRALCLVAGILVLPVSASAADAAAKLEFAGLTPGMTAEQMRTALPRAGFVLARTGTGSRSERSNFINLKDVVYIFKQPEQLGEFTEIWVFACRMQDDMVTAVDFQAKDGLSSLEKRGIGVEYSDLQGNIKAEFGNTTFVKRYDERDFTMLFPENETQCDRLFRAQVEKNEKAKAEKELQQKQQGLQNRLEALENEE